MIFLKEGPCKSGFMSSKEFILKSSSTAGQYVILCYGCERGRKWVRHKEKRRASSVHPQDESCRTEGSGGAGRCLAMMYERHIHYTVWTTNTHMHTHTHAGSGILQTMWGPSKVSVCGSDVDWGSTKETFMWRSVWCPLRLCVSRSVWLTETHVVLFAPQVLLVHQTLYSKVVEDSSAIWTLGIQYSYTINRPFMFHVSCFTHRRRLELRVFRVQRNHAMRIKAFYQFKRECLGVLSGLLDKHSSYLK